MQSVDATISLYEETLRAARLSPSDLSFYECASALPMFDIMEMEAITQVRVIFSVLVCDFFFL
jgi:hypothetical protein